MEKKKTWNMNKQEIAQQLYHKLKHNRIKGLSDAELQLISRYSSESNLTTKTIDTLFQLGILPWPLSDEHTSIITQTPDIKKLPRYIKWLIINNTDYDETNPHRILWLYVNGYSSQRMPECRTCSSPTTWSTHQGRFKYHCSNRCRALDPDVNKKRSDTCIDRYGFDKVLSNDTHVASTRTSCVENHGVEYPFQNQELYEQSEIVKKEKYGDDYKRTIANKALITIQDRYANGDRSKTYGEIVSQPQFNQKKRTTKLHHWLPQRWNGFNSVAVPMYDISDFDNRFTRMPYKCVICDNVFEDSIENGDIPRCPRCFPFNRESFQEQELAQYITSLGVNITKNTRKVIPPYELDVYIPSIKLAIEYNGLYWHSEQGSRGRVDSTYHLNKHNKCITQDVQLLHIFEDEWKNKQDIIKSIICSHLRVNLTTYARKCDIVELNASDSKKFIDNNHIQGFTPSKYNIGLEYQGELLCVMTFGKSRFNKNVEYEMYRLCTKTNNVVVGGAQKMFKYFVKTYKPSSIISYADNRLFDGNVYPKLNFVLSHVTNPGYWYVDIKNGCTKRLNRQQFQKHKLGNILPHFDNKLSESENMKNHGYSKIWDCGQSVFIWNK